MCAGFFYHLTEHFRILQHGAGTQMVVVKGLTIVICHENGGFQRFQQGHISDVGVGIVDEHAGIYIAICIMWRYRQPPAMQQPTNSPSF